MFILILTFEQLLQKRLNKALLRILIRSQFRISMFLGLLDPDPLVQGTDPETDPDPDPSIIDLDSY